MSVGVAMMAAGLFGLCRGLNGKRNGRLAPLFTELSKASFCIYLVHLFVLYLFGHFRISANSFPCLISVPVLVCANLAISYGCYFVLSKIPFVKRWLI